MIYCYLNCDPPLMFFNRKGAYKYHIQTNQIKIINKKCVCEMTTPLGYGRKTLEKVTEEKYAGKCLDAFPLVTHSFHLLIINFP